MTKELEKKVDSAIRLIRAAGKAAEREGEPVEVCYSGGKDSEVILELTKMAGVKYRAIYKNTTIDPAGTLKHVREKGVEIYPPPSKNFIQVIAAAGYPSRFRRTCCSYLKEYKILNHAIVGVRRAESVNRAKNYKEPIICRYTSRKRAHINQYLPLLEWTDDDVAEFIRERNIQCHPLYYDENGVFHVERRLGCLCCPLLTQKKRIQEFKKHPNMVKLYIRQGKIWRDNHPNSNNIKMFKDVYEWFVMTTFCQSMADFRNRFGATMFDDGINCKEYLENYFGIKFND